VKESGSKEKGQESEAEKEGSQEEGEKAGEEKEAVSLLQRRKIDMKKRPGPTFRLFLLRNHAAQSGIPGAGLVSQVECRASQFGNGSSHGGKVLAASGKYY
jgi:hypothetical protein